MRQKGRVAYWLYDGDDVTSEHYNGDISIAAYGVTLYSGGQAGSNGPPYVPTYELEGTYIIPWHCIKWIQLGD